jgi:hypothetical protein
VVHFCQICVKSGGRAAQRVHAPYSCASNVTAGASLMRKQETSFMACHRFFAGHPQVALRTLREKA